MEIQTLTPERGLSRWAPILPPVSPPTGRYVHRIGICIFSDGDSNTYARERAVEMGTNIAPCKPAHRALCAEFVIAGLIFHPSRVKSELLHKDIEQSFVELTLLPACHREDVWLLALLHAQILSTHQIERRQRGVEMKI